MHPHRALWFLGLTGLAALTGFACGSSRRDSGTASAAVAVVEARVLGFEAVAGATVALVPAREVALAEPSVDPLEDLLPGVQHRAVTGLDGRARVEAPAGSYFIVVSPGPADTRHLPGGSGSRRAIELAAGETRALRIDVSERPPDDAVYVGSSECLRCHIGHETYASTTHAVSLRKFTAQGPVVSALQRVTGFTDRDSALPLFVDGNPEDNTGGGDGYGRRVETAFGYNVLLGRDGLGYFQALESSDLSRVSERLRVAFSYGGLGRFRQVFFTLLDESGRHTTDAARGVAHALPVEHVETAGDPARPVEVTRREFRLFAPERWGAPAVDGAGVASWPGVPDSFDAACSGCHFAGWALSEELAGPGGPVRLRAHAVPDPAGPLDLDGDGQPEDVSIGCERCHGPGSRHVAERRSWIVQPELLTPGRANAVCASCHIRGTAQGHAAGHTLGYPSRDGPAGPQIPEPGLRAAELLGAPDGRVLPDFGTTGGFVATADLALATDGSSWRDRAGGSGARLDHFRAERPHFFDHARSTHAQNARQIVVCHDCHDLHEQRFPGQTVESARTNLLCLRCHAGEGDFAAVGPAELAAIESGPAPSRVGEAIQSHVLFSAFDLTGVGMRAEPSAYLDPAGPDAMGRCITCHMPRTARTAAWVRDAKDLALRGDLSAHSFDAIAPAVSESMANGGLEPVPNSCVECHVGPALGVWPDYRYRARP